LRKLKKVIKQLCNFHLLVGWPGIGEAEMQRKDIQKKYAKNDGVEEQGPHQDPLMLVS
jgi:hypothetical protein